MASWNQFCPSLALHVTVCNLCTKSNYIACWKGNFMVFYIQKVNCIEWILCILCIAACTRCQLSFMTVPLLHEMHFWNDKTIRNHCQLIDEAIERKWINNHLNNQLIVKVIYQAKKVFAFCIVGWIKQAICRHHICLWELVMAFWTFYRYITKIIIRWPSFTVFHVINEYDDNKALGLWVFMHVQLNNTCINETCIHNTYNHYEC